MLKSYIERSLTESLGFEPTEDQRRAISGLSDFLILPAEDLVFILQGYAGTGKTTLVAALVKTLARFEMEFALLAPTGRAAKVLTAYSGFSGFTIHKRIYRQGSSRDGFGRFELGANLARDCVFIVDEASMVSDEATESRVFGSGNLLEDLVEFVRSGIRCKLVLVGDPGQLPPVGSPQSPALKPGRFRALGMTPMGFHLGQVMRQARESGILSNATPLRLMIESGQPAFPEFRLQGFSDVFRVRGDELIETLADCYSSFGPEQTLVITRSNVRANKYNQGIRAMILGREEEICRDDLVMVVRNNYYWTERAAPDHPIPFFANGDIARVTRTGRFSEQYGHRFVEGDLEFLDYEGAEMSVKLMVDTLGIEGPALPQKAHQDLFYKILEDYSQESGDRGRDQMAKVRMDPYFNAVQVKFAYAVTCHKAQGGQWKAVFIDHGFPVETPDAEYLRWLYTALTRSTERVYLVNFPEKYFPDPE